MTISTNAKHLQFRKDINNVLERSAVQLNSRLDLTDATVAAFKGLLHTLSHFPKHLEGIGSLRKPKVSDLEKGMEMSEDDTESVDEYDDAQESLGLVSAGSSLLAGLCPKTTVNESDTDDNDTS